METENAKRNPQPAGGSSLPTITLAVLILTILALLYVGYEYIADDTKGSEELTNVPLDTTVQNPVQQPIEPELAAPIEIDTSSRNAPVDLSQSTPAKIDEPEEVRKPAPALDSEERPAAGKPAEEKPVAEAREEKPKKEPVEEKPKEEKPKEEKKEPARVSVPSGGVTHTHTVRPGETIYSVATKYNLSINTLKALNPDLKDNAVKADVTKLNVKVRAMHTVGPGDILRVVAEKYGVSVDALMKANGKTKNHAQRGERLIIPYADKQ
ncbi:LysM peptidoglycan-binding domain-containing protein [Larkinella soli]|uniref:LysM peptidoglycan-binding domain-containing protein n=1 Tax=Larkinella soli TaxID=1770527 RepID=UPI000FFC5F24|nr:LysM domain-containing protein [Larkinella soli]